MAVYLTIHACTTTDNSRYLKVVGTRRVPSTGGKYLMPDTVTPYVLQYQLKRNLRPFTREDILQLPTGQSGVYVLWRKTGTEGRNECLYVGESTTCVRRRLLQHYSNAQNDGLHSQLRMFRSIVQFSVEFTENAQETVLLETELIREWKPKTNLKMNPDKS